jgi:peptidoglycan/LPS O-acetylase OafA/YrhL
MRLAQLATGRDNNFNLIRMVAAIAVLVSHSYALSTGRSDIEPMEKSLGINMGDMAVDAFFVTSGFLVTASLLARRSVLDFLCARALRIYPALIVMVLLTVFGIGLAVTALPAGDYLGHGLTHRYLWKCATLIWGVAYVLPGVFADNPYKGAVNGSLWTMPFEIRMYGFLVIAWALLLFAKTHRANLFRIAVVAACAVSGALLLRQHFMLGGESNGLRLFFMFFTGAAFQILKDRIRLSHAAFAVLLLALIAAAFVDRHTFFLLYVLSIAYLLFYLAYVPGGRLRAYNRLGDYSYGFYIYAFPLQQTVALLVPGISVLAMVASAGTATLLAAVLSWHLAERHALAAKERCAMAIRRNLRLPPAPPSR